jgi:hypothetical protein
MVTEDNGDAKVVGHEPSGANVRAVWETGAGLAAVVVVSFLVVYGLMRFYGAMDNVVPGDPVSAQVPAVPGTPKLNPDQPVILRDLRERENQLLETYGWTDRSAGMVHIPIEKAMQIVAEEGLPETPPAPATNLPIPAGSNKP